MLLHSEHNMCVVLLRLHSPQDHGGPCIFRLHAILLGKGKKRDNPTCRAESVDADAVGRDGRTD